MSPARRDELERLDDVLAAVDAIRRHLARGRIDDALVFDAVRMRLLEIVEAVGALPEDMLASEPSVPWREVVAMRHKLAHHYYDTALGILEATVYDDLPELVAAVERMRARREPPGRA